MSTPFNRSKYRLNLQYRNCDRFYGTLPSSQITSIHDRELKASFTLI